jgi:mannose-6-phosphate isomerase-like protein (cupin superfamily)
MSESSKFIESGILELYVMGDTSPEQNAVVESMLETYAEVRAELNKIEISLEKYALSQAKKPDPTIKPLLMATISYIERMKSGEQPSFPPKVTQDSKVSDYDAWLKRPDMVLPDHFEGIEAHLIGVSDQVTTAIVWLKGETPSEVHKREYESFLIVEGTCTIFVDGHSNYLNPGDFFTIPLFAAHHVVVTSDIPCKAILQRVAV